MIVDLSQDFGVSETVNETPGAETVTEVAAANALIRIVLVLEHGQIVVNYTRPDVDPNMPQPVWSTTKSWTALLMGMLVQEGVLSVDESLARFLRILPCG